MNSSSDKKIGIIGGGITGLTAAWELLKSGASVTIFEPKRLGGLIKSSRQDGFTLEHGATTLALTDPFIKLLRELNLYDQIVRPHTKTYTQFVWHNGAPRLVPKGPKNLIISDLLSLNEKLRLIYGLFSAPDKTKLSATNSVHDLVSLLFGGAVATKIAAAVVRGIFGGDTRELLADLTLPKLMKGLNAGLTPLKAMRASSRKSKRPEIGLIRGGNETICKALTEKILQDASIIKEHVTSLGYEDKNFIIKTEHNNTFNFDTVIVATSGKATAQYFNIFNLNTLNKPAADLFNSIKYAEILVLHCACQKTDKLPNNGFGLLFPEDEFEDLLGILYNSKIFPHVAPESSDLLTLCFGGTKGLKKDINAYSEKATELLKNIYGITDARIINQAHWSHAIPQYDPQALILKTATDKLQRDFPGLYFIGADRGGVGVPSRIEMATSLSI